MDGTDASVINYMRELWRLRYFWFALVKNDVAARYKRSFLGIGWSLLKPLAMTAIFCLVFGQLFQIPLREYAPYVLIGMTTWQFLSECLILGSQCMVLGGAYIRQQKMPLAIFPLRTALASGFHTLVALGVAVGIAIAFGGAPNLFALLYLLPAFLVLLLVGWSLAIITGMVGTHFPDTRHLLDVGLQILFYMTPILYKPESLGERAQLVTVLEWNPVTALLALIRTPILSGEPPALFHVGIALVFLGIAATFATVLLRKLERNLIFWI